MEETVKELEKRLTWKFPTIAKKSPEQKEEAFAYCEGYKAFLNAAKTEREFTAQAAALLERSGYTEWAPGRKYAPGDKVYVMNRKKALIMTTFGTRPLEDGLRRFWAGTP